MADRDQLTAYPTPETMQQFAELLEYYKRKHKGSGVKVSTSFVICEIIRQKYVDVRNEETQSLTLKRMYALYEKLTALIEERLPPKG